MMSSSPALMPERKLLASNWHLAAVLVMLMALTAYNFHAFQVANAFGPHVTPNDRTTARACAKSITIEWLMLLFVWGGVWLKGGSMRDLTGGRWTMVN